MLTKVDRASMLASVETRVPMLDSKIINLAYNMPTEFKISKIKRKIILKDTFKDLIPEELYHQPKHGFTVPIDMWLGTIFHEKLMKYSGKAYIKDQGLFDYEYVQKMIENHFDNIDYKEN